MDTLSSNQYEALGLEQESKHDYLKPQESVIEDGTHPLLEREHDVLSDTVSAVDEKVEKDISASQVVTEGTENSEGESVENDLATADQLLHDENALEENSTAPIDNVINNNNNKVKVLLITEGTYPYYWGGVSTWCHLLANDLPEVKFTVLSLIANPRLEPRIHLPPNVVDFRPVPLWGVRNTLELRADLGLQELLQRKQQTTETVIKEKLMPHFRTFLNQVLLIDATTEQLAQSLYEMYHFFLEYDFDTAFRSQTLWNCFVETIQQDFPQAAAKHGYAEVGFTITDLTNGLQWLNHWLFPLAKPLPKVDVAHATMAGICTMIGVVVKLEHGAGLMLTEHGIYLRERYLAEANSSNSLFLKLLTLRFARRMTDLAYAYSDQISPCCDYNQRWELENGVSPKRLQTIYYGADTEKFYAANKVVGEPPVVVWVGRINPLKDLITLIKAAAKVHESRPDIKFQLYGTPPEEDIPYYEECLALRAKLELEDTVIFAGFASNPVIAYNEGDVVVLSSISEGFPYATLEAMLCGKPIVATSVGGLPEQVEGCGITVEPRNPEQMAEAILELMNDPERCTMLGKAARKKALQEFNVRQSREAHLSSYIRLSNIGHSKDIDVLENDASYVLVETENNVLTANKSVVITPKRDESSDLSEPIGNSKFQIKRHLRMPVRNKEAVWTPLREADIVVLANQVMKCSQQPIDYLEVAALLESMGTTDEVASHYYGAPDVFELAKVVLETIKAEQNTLEQPKIFPHKIQKENQIKAELSGEHQTFQQTIRNYWQGPIALFPGLALVGIIQAFNLVANWSIGQIMALSLGMTTGVLFAGSFLYGLVRRGSICLSLGDVSSCLQFIKRGLKLGTICILGMASLTFLVTRYISMLTFEERVIFCLAFACLSLIWLVGIPLSLLQAQVWLGVGLLAGMVTFLAVDRLVVPFSQFHVIFGTIFGFAMAVAVVGLAIKISFSSAYGSVKSKSLTILPSNAYLLHEAVPYFLYGLFYVSFIMLPHFIGWFGKLNEKQPSSWVVTTLEIGFTLALPPLVLVGGFAENTLRLFWLTVPKLQKIISGSEVEEFRSAIAQFYRQQRRRYTIALLTVSAAFALPVLILLSLGIFASWIGKDPTTPIMVFLSALLTYFLLGLGVFNCMFFTTMARPQLAALAVLCGILVLVVIGVPLSLLVDFRFCLVAFMISAVVFVVISKTIMRRILNSADYYYFTSF